jgi:hypothetical protein
MHMQ